MVNTLRGIGSAVKGEERIVAREVVSIRNGDYVLGVAPSAGSVITRYACDRGDAVTELLRPATDDAVEAGVPTDMSCFPLVPFSNRVRDGRFTFRGREVRLEPNFPPEPHAIHGHGWQSSWDLQERSDAGITTSYMHEADEWPWSYRAQQRFALGADALEVTISVTNTSPEAMPVGLGLHPYFVRTPRSRLATSVEKVWLSDEDSMPNELVPASNEFDLGDLNPNDVALDHNFAGWSRRALIEWPERDARLSLTATSPLDFLVVFTPPDESFFCVEPVSNTLDAFNLVEQGRTDVGTSVVEPGETLSGRITFAPEVTR